MKRKDRELNVFSMSALDLFASALGAFILITLVLMPYYLKRTPTPDPAQSCPAPTPAPTCPVCPVPIPSPVCPPPSPPATVVMDKLLMIEMRWAREVDVDLYVRTPNSGGDYYSYKKRRFPGSADELIHDDTEGGSATRAAKEYWLSFEPHEGEYEVCFEYYSGQGAVQVQGRVHKPSGPYEISKVVLQRAKQRVCLLRFRMGQDFQFTPIQ